MPHEPERYKSWKLPHWMLVHYVLNPGLVVNELLLGQRMPKVTLIDEQSDAPLVARQYVECPHCGAMNDGRLWSGRMGMGHWFGLACPECETKIPTLLNIFSIAILALTFPFWKPVQMRYEKRALARQARTLRMRGVQASPAADGKVSGIKLGLFFGSFMGAFFTLQGYLMSGDLKAALLVGAPAGLLAGVFFGGFMKLFLGRKRSGVAKSGG